MAQFNMSDNIRKLKGASIALNNVSVKGRDNMDMLLGSIQAIEQVIASLEHGMKELEPEVKLEAVPADDK